MHWALRGNKFFVNKEAASETSGLFSLQVLFTTPCISWDLLLLLEPDLGVVVDTAMSSRYCPFDCLIIRLSAVWRACKPSQPKWIVEVWSFSEILQQRQAPSLL